MKSILRLGCLLLCASVTAPPASAADDVFDRVQHGYADSGGVKIHYATLGAGPLVVMIHGFPDFWYSWRDQMAALSDRYQVVAIDQRGYNLSDKPAGKAQYNIALLAADVKAVVEQVPASAAPGAAGGSRPATGRKAVIVGHDWGGYVAWTVAMKYPEITDRLIILNFPHPRGLLAELAHNPEQAKNAEYARRFQQPDAAKALTAEGLARRVSDPVARAHYIEAFGRSDFEAMLNYYKQNYPYPPYQEDRSPVVKVTMPVLMLHGLNDTALLATGLNRNWEWVDNVLTLVTVPGAGHFVQNDAAAFVSATMKTWLANTPAR